ncbi:MAG: hypothetical protein KAJ04_09430, partial [Candidatus Eisenbacteria sp.]|nr:hypothetical protein [Candidatus Eisenbacteria bacterium]
DVSSLESYLPDYLGISGATISFRDTRTERTLTIDSIDLLLERDGEGPIDGGASGNCLGGERNFEARFTWDGSLQTLAIDGTLSDARLDERLPVPPSVPVEFREGVVSAEFYASVSPDTVRGLDLSFDIADGVVVMTAVSETLGGIQASGRLRGGLVTLESASGRWRSASWSASGATSDRGVMEGVRLEARDLPLAPVADLLELTGPRIDGRVDLSASVEGPFDTATAVVIISEGSVGVGDIALTSLSGAAALSPGSVRLEGIDARVFGGAVSVSGALEKEGPDEQWRFEFGGNARGLDVRELMAVTTGDTTGRGRVSLSEVVGGGTLDRPNLESLATWENVSFGSVRLGSGAGGFLLSDGDLSVSLDSFDKTYAVTCRVENLFDAPGVVAEIVLSGVSVDTLFPAVAEVLPPTALTGAIRVAGHVDSLSVRGRVGFACEQAEATVEVTGVLTPTDEDGGGGLKLVLDSPDASIRGVAAPFTADLVADGSEVSLRNLRLGDSVEGDMRVGLSGDRDLSAGIVVSGASLPRVLAAVLGEAPGGVDGLVFASVSVHGTVREPVATAQVTVGAATVAGV